MNEVDGAAGRRRSYRLRGNGREVWREAVKDNGVLSGIGGREGGGKGGRRGSGSERIVKGKKTCQRKKPLASFFLLFFLLVVVISTTSFYQKKMPAHNTPNTNNNNTNNNTQTSHTHFHTTPLSHDNRTPHDIPFPSFFFTPLWVSPSPFFSCPPTPSPPHPPHTHGTWCVSGGKRESIGEEEGKGVRKEGRRRGWWCLLLRVAPILFLFFDAISSSPWRGEKKRGVCFGDIFFVV